MKQALGSGKRQKRYEHDPQEAAASETMSLCPNHPSTTLNATLSAGYGNNHLNSSIFLHHTLLNTDSVRWKSRLHRIIYSSLGFLKDLFVRRHIMSSTELTSENTRTCELVSSRQPASGVLTWRSVLLLSLACWHTFGFMSPHSGHPFVCPAWHLMWASNWGRSLLPVTKAKMARRLLSHVLGAGTQSW